MTQINKNFTLSFTSNSSIPTYEFKSGEVLSRKLFISLIQNEVAFDLTGFTAKIYILKPDNTKIFDNCVIEDAEIGLISYVLTTQCTTSIGISKAEIVIYGTNNEKIISQTFQFDIAEAIEDDCAIESTNEFTALKVALNDVSSFKTEMTNAHHDNITNTDYSDIATRMDAQSASLADKAKKVFVAPEEFGAKGDGATDDTEAFQAAIDYLTNATGGEIRLSNKTYMISSLTMKTRVSIVGLGISHSILKKIPGSAGHMIIINRDCVLNNIKNVLIYGDYNSTNHGIYFENFNGSGSINMNQQWLYDKALSTANIGSYTLKWSNIQNVKVMNCGGNGIHISTPNVLIYLKNVESAYNKGYGLYCQGYDSFFDSLDFNNNGLDAIYEVGGNNKWSNVKTWFNHGTGMYIGASRSTFINIESQDNYGDGFEISQGNDCMFVNCISDNNGLSTYSTSTRTNYGFYVYNNSINIMFKNCLVTAYRLSKPYKAPYLVKDSQNVDIDIRYDVNACLENPKAYNSDVPSQKGFLLCNRTGAKTVDTIAFAAGVPAITSNGLDCGTDKFQFDVNMDDAKSFSVVLDFTYATTSGTPRLIADNITSGSEAFTIIYNPTNNPSYVLFKVPNDFSNPWLQLNATLVDGTKYRIVYTVDFNNNGRYYVSIYDSAGNLIASSNNTVDNLIASPNNTVTTNYIKGIKSLFINPTAVGMAKVQMLLITTQNLDKSDFLFGSNLSKYYAKSCVYFDFTAKTTNYSNKKNEVSFLPTPSSYYEGQSLYVIESNVGKLKYCQQTGVGTYAWIDVY